MFDIFHTFIIHSSAEKIFEGISAPDGLDNWWTRNSEGNPKTGSVYRLDFGPEYIWEAIVTKNIGGKEFEFEMTKAEAHWIGTRIGFKLNKKSANTTEVSFYHTGWPENSENYRISSYCWAMYLRILKRNIELGEQVPYAKKIERIMLSKSFFNFAASGSFSKNES